LRSSNPARPSSSWVRERSTTIPIPASDSSRSAFLPVGTALVRRRADRRRAIQDLEECARDQAAGLVDTVEHEARRGGPGNFVGESMVSYAFARSLTICITNKIKETACRFKITPKPSRRELGSGSATILMPMAKAPGCESNSLQQFVEGTAWRSRAQRKSAILSCRPCSNPRCRSS
jgi:hypothetical protein